MHPSPHISAFPPPAGLAQRLGERLGAPVHSFSQLGQLADIAAPCAAMVDFADVASRLARVARFNGAAKDGGRGLAFSVAQHSVMGAQALMVEGESRHTAALFLLHDAHEYVIGDITAPAASLITEVMEGMASGGGELYRAAVERIKDGWDAAIYAAAGLPAPMVWPSRVARVIRQMDARMCAAEAEALFGASARRAMPASKFPPPRTRGAVEPWGAMKAEEEFSSLLRNLVQPARCAA